ncbi:DNA polymerase Y family protein [Glaciihabitans arcticus]|uniref:DNA polymerase Y family protein n=1 Tax=Glaciihabitans arcticus TaxID=2668039 RepID=UPI00138682C7|nr:hypothetical protein [Glaciihabitans arcticus]
MARSLLLHVDADSFFASVVLRRRPELVHRPMAVVAHVFIASANYPARAFGVRGGMLAQEALALCGELQLIDVPREEVEQVSDQLFDIFGEDFAAVEPGSMEEAFIDSGTSDPDLAAALGQQLRARVKRELGISVSVGVGRTKLMAKLASRTAKPDGLHVISPVDEAQLRISIPIDDVWGIGGKTVEKLRLIGVIRLGDLDSRPREEVQRVCGTTMARKLWRIREGTDDAVIHSVESRTSLTTEGTISGYNRRDWNPAELMQACIARVCRRAERAGLVATGLAVALRAEGGEQVVLKHGLADASASVDAWTAALLPQLVDAPKPLVGLRVTLTGLTTPDRVQPALF